MNAPEATAKYDLKQLVEKALAQGIKQVEAVGSPLNPFFLDESGTVYFLYNPSGVDPMELALPAIKEKAPAIRRCALVIDSRIAGQDGKKWDAILVMACERDVEHGELWAHRYVPKGLFRKFRTEGGPEQVGKSKNFIQVALADA